MDFSAHNLSTFITDFNTLLRSVRQPWLNVNDKKIKFKTTTHDFIMTLKNIVGMAREYNANSNSVMINAVNRFINVLIADYTNVDTVNNNSEFNEIIDKYTDDYLEETYYFIKNFYLAYDLSSATKFTDDMIFKKVADLFDTNATKINLINPYSYNYNYNSYNDSLFVTTIGKFENLKDKIIEHKVLNCQFAQDTDDKKNVKFLYGLTSDVLISNSAFDIGYLDLCEIYYRDYDNMSDYFSKYYRLLSYVKPNAPVVIKLKTYQMYSNLCTVLAKTLSDLEIVASDHSFWRAEKESTHLYCYIVGRKKAEKIVDKKTFNNLMNFIVNEKEYIDKIEFTKYSLYGNTDIPIYRSKLLDENLVLDYIKNNDITTKLLPKFNNVDSSSTKRPLLPFTPGQIGLALVSGCIDGIIDEGDNYRHLIKGRSIKLDMYDEFSNYDEAGKETVTKTVTATNRIEVTMLTPDGDFITLR